MKRGRESPRVIYYRNRKRIAKWLSEGYLVSHVHEMLSDEGEKIAYSTLSRHIRGDDWESIDREKVNLGLLKKLKPTRIGRNRILKSAAEPVEDEEKRKPLRFDDGGEKGFKWRDRRPDDELA